MKDKLIKILKKYSEHGLQDSFFDPVVDEILALIEEQEEEKPFDNNCIIVGCYDCPVCDRNDMCAGYSCRLLSSPDSFIKENKKYQPVTPKWCPIKKQPLIIQYGRRIQK